MQHLVLRLPTPRRSGARRARCGRTTTSNSSGREPRRARPHASTGARRRELAAGFAGGALRQCAAFSRARLHLGERPLDRGQAEAARPEWADDARGALGRVPERAARVAIRLLRVLIVVFCEEGLLWDRIVERGERRGLEEMLVWHGQRQTDGIP